MLKYLKFIFWFIIITIGIIFTSLGGIATIFGLSFWLSEVKELIIMNSSLFIGIPLFLIGNIIILILYKILNKLHYGKLIFLSYCMITLSSIGILIYGYLIIESFSLYNGSRHAIQSIIYSVASFFFCIFYVIIGRLIFNKAENLNQSI